MNERDDSADSNDAPDEKNPRDQGFGEAPAPQGLKKPPTITPGEESGEWTRGGGTDPNEPESPAGGPRNPTPDKGAV